MSADAHVGHEKSAGHGESGINKGFSWIMGTFTKLALTLGIIVGGVLLTQAALPGIAAAATSFFSSTAGGVVVPKYMLAGAGIFALGRMSKEEGGKKEKPAAHGAAHH